MFQAEQFEHRGVIFWVGLRAPFPGYGWRIVSYDHLSRPTGETDSPGAFYDEAPDHPEGGREWARQACIRYIDKLLDGSQA